MRKLLSRFPQTGRVRGLYVLALVLGVNALLSVYSSASGVSDAVAFVRKSKDKLPKLSGKVRSICSVLPATQQFGYFAPQVCSEFRLLVSLGNSKDGEVREVTFDVGSEAELLLSSLNTATQDEGPARVISAAYAVHALDQYPEFDFARVYVQAEYMPPLREATIGKKAWITIRGYYFKK